MWKSAAGFIAAICISGCAPQPRPPLSATEIQQRQAAAMFFLGQQRPITPYVMRPAATMRTCTGMAEGVLTTVNCY